MTIQQIWMLVTIIFLLIIGNIWSVKQGQYIHNLIIKILFYGIGLFGVFVWLYDMGWIIKIGR
jgi:hypothetical protein